MTAPLCACRGRSRTPAPPLRMSCLQWECDHGELSVQTEQDSKGGIYTATVATKYVDLDTICKQPIANSRIDGAGAGIVCFANATTSSIHFPLFVLKSLLFVMVKLFFV